MARAPRAAALQEIEAVPEADRLEGFAHPRETEALIGHLDAQARIVEAFASGRMHHAWLISGTAGIGKATLAYAIARYGLATAEERAPDRLTVPATSIAARQVRALSHPGLILIRRPWNHKDKRLAASITVDEVRRLKSFLTHSAAPGTWRVVIVDQADELNANAANALLKSLEEPPPRALFLLISSEPGRLLATIRSRCRRLALEPLPADELRSAATNALAAASEAPKMPSDAEWASLAVAAQGSVRRALTLIAGDGAKLAERTRALVALLPKVDWPQVHALSDEVSGAGTEQRFEQFYTLLSDQIGRLIRASAVAGQPGEADTDEARVAHRVIPAHALAAWAELWETMQSKKAETLGLNLDRKSLILELFARLQAAARP